MRSYKYESIIDWKSLIFSLNFELEHTHTFIISGHLSLRRTSSHKVRGNRSPKNAAPGEHEEKQPRRLGRNLLGPMDYRRSPASAQRSCDMSGGNSLFPHSASIAGSNTLGSSLLVLPQGCSQGRRKSFIHQES